MNVHVTLDGGVYDLLALDDEQFGFYHKCLQAYRANTPVGDYLNLIQDPKGALMRGSNTVTKKIFGSTLYKLAQDLEFRLRIKQGLLRAKHPEYAEQEPAQADEYLSANAAAKEKGVSVTAIIKAINEGRLAAHQEENGRWKVPTKALAAYNPDPVRQAARKG